MSGLDDKKQYIAVVINQIYGNKKGLKIDIKSTIEALKLQLILLFQLEVYQQVLLLRNKTSVKELRNELTIESYNIKNGDEIILSRSQGLNYFKQDGNDDDGEILSDLNQFDNEFKNEENINSSYMVDIDEIKSLHFMNMLIETNPSIIKCIKDLCKTFISPQYIDVYEEAKKASKGIIIRKASSQFTLCVFDGVNFTYRSTSKELLNFVNEEVKSNDYLWFRLAYLHLFPVDIENGRPEIANNGTSINKTFQQIERVFRPGFAKHFSLNNKKIVLYVGDLLPIVCEPKAMEYFSIVPQFLQNLAYQTLYDMKNAFGPCNFGLYIL